MAEVDAGGSRIDADIRLWDPETRRNASLIVLGAAGLFLVAALLYFGLDAASSGWFLWVAIVVLALLLLAEAAIVATGIAREEGGPPWLAGPGAQAATAQQAPAAPPAEEHVHIDLKCPECAELFSVHDTGERPLHTQCPHCGAEGHVDLDAPPPGRVGEEEPQTDAAYSQATAGAGTVAGRTEPPTRTRAEDPFGDIDPVTDIEDIGDVYGDRLLDLGIETTQDLWHADTVEIAGQLNVSTKRVENWQERAEFMAISGIGPQYAELLERVGIDSIADLAAQQAAELTSRLEAKQDELGSRIQGTPVTEGRVERWITLAQDHEPGAQPEGDVETLSLKCPACETEFEVDDTGERPLEAICPGCGRGGKLK